MSKELKIHSFSEWFIGIVLLIAGLLNGGRILLISYLLVLFGGYLIYKGLRKKR